MLFSFFLVTVLRSVCMFSACTVTETMKSRNQASNRSSFGSSVLLRRRRGERLASSLVSVYDARLARDNKNNKNKYLFRIFSEDNFVPF